MLPSQIEHNRHSRHTKSSLISVTRTPTLIVHTLFFHSSILSLLPLLHQLPNWLLQRILSLKPQIRRKEDNEVIESNEDTENTKIPPSVGIRHTERLSKFVTGSILAELAYSVGSSLYVPTCLCDVGLYVGFTCLSWRSAETGEL